MRVVRIPTVVDLPAPLGPSRPKISPAWISSEIPSSARISVFDFFFFFASPRIAIRKPPGAAMGGGE